jgi:type IV pilus assembly protein PilB
MTKESEEGARLREALSQCDVFREDGDDAADVGVATPANSKKGAPPAAQESAASPERSGSIRDALDKLFVGSDSNHVEADEPPRAAAAPAPPAPIPKNTRGTGVDSILERAGYALAETLHFDPQGNDYAAWTRSAGKRISLGKASGSEVESRFGESQESARTNQRAQRREILCGSVLRRARLDVLPTARGVRYVVRGFADVSLETLEEIGLDPEVVGELRAELTQPRGGLVILGCAPRQGAHTTLRALGVECASQEKLVVSLVAGRGGKPHKNLVELAPSPGGTRAASLEEALMHDPDAIVVGRLAHKEEAAIALSAACAGVRVFCAVNATNPDEAFAALRSLGIDDATIAQSRPAFTTQRLLSSLCLLCRESDEKAIENLRPLGFTGSELRAATFYKAVGCDRCLAGYRGRFAVLESISHPRPGVPREEFGNGKLSLLGSGFRSVARGRTTVEELVRSMDGDAKTGRRPAR